MPVTRETVPMSPARRDELARDAAYAGTAWLATAGTFLRLALTLLALAAVIGAVWALGVWGFAGAAELARLAPSFALGVAALLALMAPLALLQGRAAHRHRVARAGAARTALAAGTEELVTVTLQPGDLALPHDHGVWIVTADGSGSVLINVSTVGDDPRAALAAGPDLPSRLAWRRSGLDTETDYTAEGPTLRLDSIDAIDGLQDALTPLGLTDVPDDLARLPFPPEAIAARLRAAIAASAAAAGEAA